LIKSDTANRYKVSGNLPLNLPLCLAPGLSMRFNHSGNIIACCFNRKYILGKYPERSINEIWFGEKVEQLRNAIYNNDLSKGCQDCERYIINENFDAAGSRQYDYLQEQSQNKNYPTMFDFELDSVCNFECIMCSGEYSTAIRVNREKQKPYFSPYDENFVEQLKEFIPHLSEARFIGGEPFLIKIYYRIWDEIINLNPKMVINVLTNASVLNDRVMKMIEKGNFKISVSIDSIIKSTYEKIRGNADYESVMKNVRYFKDMMDKNGHVMNFNVCAMRQNQSEIPDYFRYCNEHNIKVVLHTVDFPNHCSLWNLSSTELKKIFGFYENQSFQKNTQIEKDNSATFYSLVNQIKAWIVEAERREHLPSITYEKMLEILFHKIEVMVKEDNNGLKVDDYIVFLQQLLNKFSVDDRKIIVRFLEKLPVHLLVSELNISSEERMTERFKTIVSNKET
jgi:MoaA/NifB/PqqE/SkfB family radical SAM enzyme